MRQGEIWLVDLEPSSEKEQAGKWPVVIISGDLLNSQLKIVIICPLTSKIKNFHKGLIIEPDERNGLQLQSEVLGFHIRAVSKLRLMRRLGRIDLEQVKKIKANIDDLLTL